MSKTNKMLYLFLIVSISLSLSLVSCSDTVLTSSSTQSSAPATTGQPSTAVSIPPSPTPVNRNGSGVSITVSSLTIGPVVVSGNNTANNSNSQSPEATTPAANPTPTSFVSTPVPATTVQGKSIPPTVAIEDNKKATNFPCEPVAQFALTKGPFSRHIGKRACLEVRIKSAGARVPNGDVYINFDNYNYLDGIIQAEIRGRFSKSLLDNLKGKNVRLYGTFAISPVLRVPILEIEWPEQIEILP